MSTPLVRCACGKPLDDGKSEGVWTMGGMAVEYRTCAHCRSTRAWMPAPVLAGRRVSLYRDAGTSEVSGEWDSLLDALEQAAPSEGAELIRNGVRLAVVAASPLGGELVWFVQRPTIEVGA